MLDVALDQIRRRDICSAERDELRAEMSRPARRNPAAEQIGEHARAAAEIGDLARRAAIRSDAKASIRRAFASGVKTS